jgi:glycosyltransferase involved in cell wall biosynthesis
MSEDSRAVSRPGSSSRLDILFVIGGLDVGGTERHLLKLSRELRRGDWRVCIYSLAGDGPLRREFDAAGVSVVLPPIGRTDISNNMILRAMRLVLAACHLTYAMMRLRPRIAHFFLPAAYIIGAIAASLARIEIRVMSRRSLGDYQRAYPLVHRIETNLHRRMNAVLGNSKAVIRELREYENVPSNKLGLIYNGIELRVSTLGDRAFVRSSMEIDDRTLVFIIVANLIPYKGHLDLIAAFGIADDQIGQPWRLLIVGRDDGAGADIRDLARKSNIERKLMFLGVRSDVDRLLSASDVALLCSHQEGFSNAILESMAAGLPMIVTNVGGNSEAVLDGKTGLVVPARDPEALAAAIIHLAGDPELRQRLGSAGRERVASQFSLEACMAKYQSLYRGLLQGKRPCEVHELEEA